MKTFAIYCTIWDFYLLSKNKFWKTEECGKSKFRSILANQLTLLALEVMFLIAIHAIHYVNIFSLRKCIMLCNLNKSFGDHGEFVTVPVV